MGWVEAVAVVVVGAIVLCALWNADTVPVADLLPQDPLPPDPPTPPDPRSGGDARYFPTPVSYAHAERLTVRAYEMGYDKGYHDACAGLPKDPDNGSGVVRWTGGTRG
jgi:hypothetical protein